MSDIKGDFSLYLITISMHACSVAQLCPTLCNPTDCSHEQTLKVNLMETKTIVPK